MIRTLKTKPKEESHHPTEQTEEQLYYFGPSWSKQSCWLDSSLMALFFPDEMYTIFSNFIQQLVIHSHDTRLNGIRNALFQIVDQIRTPTETFVHVNVDEFRSSLHNLAKRRDNKFTTEAFEQEGEEGYVYFFILEFLKLFQIPCVQGHGSTPHSRKRRTKRANWENIYIHEIEDCNGSTIEECLQSSYKGWNWKNPQPYLIVETIENENSVTKIVPQEQLTWNSQSYQLCSMIVYDCSHFVAYVKKGDTWYLYDDGNALRQKPLNENSYEFGTDYYERFHCKFNYSRNNAFFFYTRRGT